MYDQPNAQLDTNFPQADGQSYGQTCAQSDAENGANLDTKFMPNTEQNSVKKSDVKAMKLFDAAALKKIESVIKSAPLPPRKLTKTEALSELIPELKRQHVRGHTAVSLAAALDANGLHVSVRKMAQLLRHQP
jgi:hypothetical protein